jgi:hypothetical protein
MLLPANLPQRLLSQLIISCNKAKSTVKDHCIRLEQVEDRISELEDKIEGFQDGG